MRLAVRICASVTLLVVALAAGGRAQESDLASPTEPTLYLVATAHLDTQGRWTIQDVIRDCIPTTLERNFALLDRYPGYVFNFEGAFRYGLIKEYYPEHYRRLKAYVAAGRWKVAGSWLDAVDVNIPAPESLIRHALYGNGFFQREFGQVSRDVFLPDGFGFAFSLPAVAAHCGLLGFSTQRLPRTAAAGMPFDIGLWEGVDGSRLIAALDPGPYATGLDHDLSSDSTWIAAIEEQTVRSGHSIGYTYFGTGDRGGAPSEASVSWMERSLNGAGPLVVRPAASDQLARDLTRSLKGDLAIGLRPGIPLGSLDRLPNYRGELRITDQGVGAYTSQAAMKRWNRKNELLASAAEPAAVMAHWLGAQRYPHATLHEAWKRFLWHQFHDDLNGTSIPEAYVFSWNDQLISMNQFAEVLRASAGAVSRAMDTQVRNGQGLLVYNPLSIPREDIVVAQVRFPQGIPREVRIYDYDDREIPAQSRPLDDGRVEVVFLAQAPPFGFALYQLRGSHIPNPHNTGLRADRSMLENHRYRVGLDRAGDIVSIYDKSAGRELLSGPLQLQIITDRPEEWPAREIDYADLMAAPRHLVGRPATINVLEDGPARVTLEVERRTAGSTFRQRISLAAGDAGNQVVIANEIDWRTPGALVKAAFPLAVANETTTYDLRLGTIERPVNRPELYEVPAQRWADLTDRDGTYGVAILNESRYGWDRPDERTLRLTLVRTPAVNERWDRLRDQETQDFGRHHTTFALCGHTGDWREGAVPWEAERLNQPLRAFQVPSHRGWLGKRFSFVEVSPPTVAVRALKLAEEGDEIVIRLQEIAGQPVDEVLVRFAAPVATFREINGAEESLASPPSGEGTVAGPAALQHGAIRLSLGAYQPRTLALRLEAPAKLLDRAEMVPVALPFNVDGISNANDPTDGDFDGRGHSLDGDLLPGILSRQGVAFRTGPRKPGWANMVACQEQRIAIPQGEFDRLYLLAAAIDGDRMATFTIEPRFVENYTTDLWIQDWSEPIGQWNSRVQGDRRITDPARIAPAYLKPATVAWVGTHRHDGLGQTEPYVATNLFRYTIELPHETSTVVLPNDDRVRILAVTAGRNPNDVARPTQPIIAPTQRIYVGIHAPRWDFIDVTQVTLSTPVPDATIHYTLDGSPPQAGSPLYTEPITLTETTSVKARAFTDGMDNDYVAEATFVRQAPRPPSGAAALQAGLRCHYYEGEWDSLPDPADLTSQREAIVPAVGIPDFARPENFLLVFEGLLEVPRKGIYTFSLAPDDGSVLEIGGECIVGSDGLRGELERRNNVALLPGTHPVRLLYFQRSGEAALQLSWEGPRLPRESVPVSAWSLH
ncbi:MAG: chitobiase/beta-hexosaminidase C-terminal domain-containing protein [Candidatus Eisenbacteria sp.]|nr:chitobiase/beta-hexosaminidase C-terminal domain-containing protein [Candidatus Eisenbacteria bacterium]